MENNLALVLKREEQKNNNTDNNKKKKRRSYIQNSSAIVYGVLFTPPLPEHAGVSDAYMPRNSGIMKPAWKEKATGH